MAKDYSAYYPHYLTGVRGEAPPPTGFDEAFACVLGRLDAGAGRPAAPQIAGAMRRLLDAVNEFYLPLYGAYVGACAGVSMPRSSEVSARVNPAPAAYVSWAIALGTADGAPRPRSQFRAALLQQFPEAVQFETPALR